MKKFSKKRKAYSLLELLFSMAVSAIILILFFNVITKMMIATVETSARTNIREEVSFITSALKRDFRNAEEILTCVGDQTNECKLKMEDGKIVTWKKCTVDTKKLCRYEDNQIKYMMPQSMDLSYIEIASGFGGENLEGEKANIQFNIAVKSTNKRFEDDLPIVSTNTISTRNYTLSNKNTLPKCENGIQEKNEVCANNNY